MRRKYFIMLYTDYQTLKTIMKIEINTYKKIAY